MSLRFEHVLNQIRSMAESEAHKGRLFERLMKTWFTEDPVFADRFSGVWMWNEWARRRSDFDGADIGVDLVAEERAGGYCAIQVKCYAPKTRISKQHLDSFISASARAPFTARIVVDTGDSWGPNARKTVRGLTPRCTVIRPGGLLNQPFDWPDLRHQEPEELARKDRIFQLRPHQKEAVQDVLAGFKSHDRGKLVMACGTGKTFVALRIAEKVAGVGGCALYLVPSISLLSQAMREWATHRRIPHRYIGICSDTTAGKRSEDASFEELEIPVTTDPKAIAAALQEATPDAMTVVFCTYQSLPVVEHAQAVGAAAFDLALADEAHRTTGIERDEEGSSPFVLIHDGMRIRVNKRLYMTATPRLYTEGARAKAARHDVEVFSMDDPGIYGPELHRLPFSKAVEQSLLSDYRVVILTLTEDAADPVLQRHLSDQNSEINISDATKIVGCWRALQNPENVNPREERPRRLGRAIAFTNTIQSSKRLTEHWANVVEQAASAERDPGESPRFTCDVRHVDGTDHALERRARLEWLRGTTDVGCRILSNARCLTEGIDVPALDAVLFMSPRNSHVDIVQAVGRAMRKAPDKEYGYIILPVAIPVGVEPADALNDNERFAAVWGVLRALRSHDDRLDAEINRMDLNRKPSNRVILSNGQLANEEEDGRQRQLLPFPPLDVPAGAIYARIVEKCGDRRYWETWARDVADIFERLVLRIGNLLRAEENETLREWFDAFHGELKASINDSITRENAVEMMAQHILTRPVFEALFEDYDFAAGNPVARALDGLRHDFGEFGLENEIRELETFYESVRQRAAGLDNADARQRVLMELYEKFFSNALRREADRLGIVYTPVEVVDFILHSADHVLRSEFGRGLGDDGVHVLDPFTGTGIFLVRLLQSGLIADSDVERTYRSELWANEIVLLAYYIAAVHIEEAFRGRTGEGAEYEPFRGIALTDTFNLQSHSGRLPGMWLPDNSERVARQRAAPIQVIVGNPPWSTGQRSSADENPNVEYPALERRVAESYAARSTATNKNSLYATQKMAIRWASDRIGTQGVIAFVTNGSWIEGNVDSGVRASLAEEFSSVQVLNLRGNQRTQGDLSRREGGKIFGSGSRATVAITLLVKNPAADHEGCRILYRDIGDYLTREEKLGILREAGSVAGIEDWRLITPDRHHDWIGQRSEAFRRLLPLGSKEAKAGKADDAIFRLFSNGYKTKRDAYLYNFSRKACAENANLAVDDYMGAMMMREAHPEYSVDDVTRARSRHIRWDPELAAKMGRGKRLSFREDLVRETAYRPFVKQYLYAEPGLAQRPSIMASMFPLQRDPGVMLEAGWHQSRDLADRGRLDDSVLGADGGHDAGRSVDVQRPVFSPLPVRAENRVICVPGVGANKPFSVLVADAMPDLHFLEFGQCFPRWFYTRPRGVFDDSRSAELERVDNISAAAIAKFRDYCGDTGITAEDVFDYVYGVLHAPAYREPFVNDLAKELPRVPLAPDFHAFATAGRDLAALHLGYETCPEHPLELVFSGGGEPGSQHFRLGRRAMRFSDPEQRELVVNEFLRLRGIPAAAHRYEVNGRTPLGWFLDRYRITEDRSSGIVNDPNDWFVDPCDLITAIRRLVYVSVETVRIVESLPNPLAT